MVLMYVGVVVELGPSVAQLVERLTVVFYTVFQYTRKSIGRWFDSGHSDFMLPFQPALPALFLPSLRLCGGVCCLAAASQSPLAASWPSARIRG
jgi:hypothetical protein